MTTRSNKVNWVLRPWGPVWSLVLLIGLWLAGCAVGGHPPNATPWHCDPQADAAVEAEDWQQGLAGHEQLLRREPSNCLALFHLAFIYGELGERPKEIEYYIKAKNCGYINDERLFFNLGMAQAAMGQFQAARQALEQAIALNPGSAENYFGLGLIQRDAGLAHQALAAMKRAVTLDPLHWEARIEIVRIYLDQSRWKKAGEQLAIISRSDPDNEALPRLRAILKQRKALEYRPRWESP